MPRTQKSPTTRKTTLYRLRAAGPIDREDLTSFVVPKYLDRTDFTSRRVEHDGIDGYLVTGTVSPGPADWCRHLARIVGGTVEEENRTSMGLLVLRTDTAIYGLGFGMGHNMLDPARIDPGFGIGFAVRCLDEDQVTKVRRQVMDARGRTDDISATQGENIKGFGIERFGEIVGQISGLIEDVPLTFTKDRDRPAHLTGSDRSIKVHLGTTPATLLRDLRAIEEVCDRPDPLPGLSFIAQVRPLKPSTEIAKQLDERLDAMLGQEDLHQVALAVPGDCRDQFELAEAFSVKLGGKPHMVTELDLDDMLTTLRDRPDGQRLRTLRDGRIVMCGDTEGEQAISRSLSADQWFTAEITDGAVHYFRSQGQWYEIGAEYVSVIEQRIADLLARAATVTLPAWPAELDEGRYNEKIAEQDGYVLLDKKDVHTSRFRGGGLEIADALGPVGQLICVKKADKTAPLNHLFAQGRVAVETLRFDRQVREQFLAKIPDDHPADRSFRSPTVVYAVLLKNGVELTPDTLFGFAKVALLQAATALEGMGAELQIVSISRDRPSGSADRS